MCCQCPPAQSIGANGPALSSEESVRAGGVWDPAGRDGHLCHMGLPQGLATQEPGFLRNRTGLSRSAATPRAQLARLLATRGPQGSHGWSGPQGSVPEPGA